MTEPTDPTARRTPSGGWGPGGAREHEREERRSRRHELFKRTTGRDPDHPIAGSQRWAETRGFALSAQEISQRLLALSQDTAAMGMVQEAKTQVESLGNEAVAAMGDGHPAVGDVMGPISQASQLCDQLIEAITAACGAIAGVGHTIGGSHG